MTTTVKHPKPIKNLKKIDKCLNFPDKRRKFVKRNTVKEEKTYKIADDSFPLSVVNEPDAGYLISTSRQGIPFPAFTKMTENSPFSLDEWSGFLHLSERTIQRYKKEKKTFDPIHSEKILEITMLYNRGAEVFGSNEKFDTWLDSKSIALGGIKPKELLDSTFGIGVLKNELTRIEHGVLA
jgi:putative toxin-antitoxin system antitoxin component (TIGR02293 family)